VSAAQSDAVQGRLRALPAVDRLAAAVRERSQQDIGAPEALAAARVTLEERRGELLAGADDDVDLVERVRARLRSSLRRVINATGVIVHTNLGRAPLAQAAIGAVIETAAGYANLEFDLDSGERGSRHVHVSALLRELTGAEDAIVVNNGAGAMLLALAAIVGDDGAAAVSRGQLVEIGGGFRVPELAQAGVRLIEVGTTNRTRRADYERAVANGASAILRVHQSNFRTVGFVQEVEIEDLCSVGVPVIDDIGSGALVTDLGALAQEPDAARSLRAGAAAVCFSGDKLLGGPQAGVLIGTRAAIAACRKHPLARALRIGRLPLAALVATLLIYRDPHRASREIPVLAMLTASAETLQQRADRLLAAAKPVAETAELIDAVARVGGGALPLLDLRGPVLALGDDDPHARHLAHALRAGDPPLVGRLADGRLLIDPRTIADDEMPDAADAIRTALTATSGPPPAART
jgi:L-seryl-tRNA(Ser) seleniumtransferase